MSTMTNMADDAVESLLTHFTRWASSQPNIQAVALVGSYARHAATEASDVDLVILTNQPHSYLQNTQWVRLFGQAEREQVEHYGNLTSLRVWYQHLEVEYGFADETWPLDDGARKVMAAGIRVLFQRGQVLSQHQVSG